MAILLFSTSLFAQAGTKKSVWSDNLRDSVRTEITDSLNVHLLDVLTGDTLSFTMGSGTWGVYNRRDFRDSIGLDWRTFEDYGAVGDSTADDTQAIEDALNSGFQIRGIPGAKYRITSAITIRDVDIDITCDGSTFDFIADLNDFTFLFGVTAIDTVTLSSSVIPNDTVWVVSDGSNLTKDMIVQIYSTTDWRYGAGSGVKGELHYSTRVSGDSLFTELKAFDSYTVPSPDTVTIIAFNPIRVKLSNFNIIYPTHRAVVGMYVQLANNTLIDNIEIDGAKTTGLAIWYSYKTEITNSTIKNATEVSTGYGISVVGITDISIQTNYFFNCRRGVDISTHSTRGPGRIFKVRGNTVAGNRFTIGDGLGTHAGAEFGDFTGNYIYNVDRDAFIIRGGNIDVIGNTIFGSTGTVVKQTAGKNLRVIDNNYISLGDTLFGEVLDENRGFVHIDSVFAHYDSSSYLIVRGNTAGKLRQNDFFFRADIDLWNVEITDNNVIYNPTPAANDNVYFLLGNSTAPPYYMYNSTIKDNRITVINGTFNFNLSDRLLFGDSSYVEYTLDGVLTRLEGLISESNVIKPTNAEVTDTNVIKRGMIYITVSAVTYNTNDFIVLPSLADVPNGHTITILNNAGGNFELRTPASSNEKINTVDADGTQELLMTDTETVIITKVSNTDGWTAHALPLAGGVGAAVAPN